MGKYSNVNASSLSNTISNMILFHQMSSNTLSNVKSDLANKNNFSSEAIDNAVKAIEKIISSNKNGTISNINNRLINLKNVSDKIKNYQNIENDIAKLNKKLYYDETERVVSKDAKGKEIVSYVTHTYMDYNVYNNIQSLKKQLNSLELEIDSMLS